MSGRLTAPVEQEQSAPFLTKSYRDSARFPVLAHRKIEPAKYKSDGGGSVTVVAPQRQTRIIAWGKYALPYIPLYLKSSHGSISISSIILSDSVR